jgi:hypothetical protein
MSITTVKEWADVPAVETEAHARVVSLADLLAKRRFNFNTVPAPIQPIYELLGNPISTSGNLTSITSAVKTGKSAVVGAMMASAMAGEDAGDCLGFTSCNPKELALISFDSEQSPDDHWRQNARALRRAGLQEPPPWLYSYCLTGLGSTRAWECVKEAIRSAAEQHDGVHSILIDGVADLVADVNDPGESNDFIAELHEVAIERACSIIGVIHFNPGGEKTRGHLGSQLERKAETNLRLDKSDQVTTIWSDKQRRAPIPKGSGPCFAWDDTDGMHVTVESRQSSKDADKRESLLALAEDVFAEHPAMRYSDLVSTVQKLRTVRPRAAEKKISEMIALTVLRKSIGGMYQIAKQANTK